ncbi:nitrate ABC transporter permease [Bordetella sp. H567]|uniref:ABC transporter permease n=1 Tax=Bordetella sp. H567 TaxID=1697043 RepID=UPI00081D14D2|nr:ABC transporter permease subunit [Bordetella sp. H567]AOB30510.1 nitrate ABC transporter permease [Bordetella sp. H567]
MNRRTSITRNTLTLLVAIVAVWQVLYWLVGDVALRSPAQTLEFTLRFVTTAQFAAHLAETARAFGMALVLAVVSGLTIGFALGGHRFLGEVFEPMLIALYSIPKITLYPILLLAFGLGISSKVAFGTIHGVIPIALFTINAVRNVRAVHLKTGRVMSLGPWDMVTRIIFPSALPEIFAGLRIGFSLTLIGTLLGEMFASQRGLGFLLMSAIGLHNVDLIMTLTVLLTLFAGTASVILLAINQRLRARMSA